MDKERMAFSLKKEILPFVTTRINLQDTMLSDRSQTQKDKYRMVSRTCGIF